MQIDLKYSTKHWNPLIRYYFNEKLRKAIKMACLKPGDIVLDFGCGHKSLRKHLPGYCIYYGYDIDGNPDIKDYKIKADVVFALDVFEHIKKNELDKILKNLASKKPRCLITTVPTEAFIPRVIDKLFMDGVSFTEHELSDEETIKLISKYFKKVSSKRYFGATNIIKWVRK